MPTWENLVLANVNLAISAALKGGNLRKPEIRQLVDMLELFKRSEKEPKMNNENLRPFNTMSPEEHRELSRRGGIASGERRRYLAALRLEMIEALAGYDLARETREEYRRSIRRYVREERKKRRQS